MPADQVRLFTVTDEDDGIRLDRWFRRNLPEVELRPDLALGADRPAPPRRQARRARRPDRGRPEHPRAAAGRGGARADEEAAASAPTLSADEIEFVRSLVIHEDKAAIVVNKPPGLATQGGTKTKDHLDRLLDGLADEGEPRPKLVHRLDKDTSGALLVARTPRAAAFFSKSFSGRTARKVYWALVIDVPSVDDGMIDLPLAKQPGTGGEKMHVDEAEGPAGADPLPGHRARRQPRRLGRAAAAHRPHPPAARPSCSRSAIRSSATANMAARTPS